MRFSPFRFQSAPGILGALFLALCGCEREQNGPDWENHLTGNRPLPETSGLEAGNSSSPVTTTPADRSARSTTESASPDGVRFIVYNVRNWLEMERGTQDGEPLMASKPEKEKAAVISLLIREQPDIVGLCEVGGDSDVREIQKRLEVGGHSLPHRHLASGSDPTRRLALISRHPIRSMTVHERLTYRLNNREHSMLRGILDVTIGTPVGDIRFLGVHFKSKREIPDGDQEMMRRHEAHLLRRTLDEIFRDDPTVPLVVYGDMNDTRQSSTLRTIQGPGNSPRSLLMVALKDSRGEFWTHHWSTQDVYSRLDYVLVSSALRNRIAWNDCTVIDHPDWSKASDHRPLRVVFRK